MIIILSVHPINTLLSHDTTGTGEVQRQCQAGLPNLMARETLNIYFAWGQELS